MVDLRVENTVLVNKWTLMGVEILEFNNCLLTVECIHYKCQVQISSLVEQLFYNCYKN